MIDERRWLALDRRGLRAALAAGHPVDPSALDDARYVGLSLGLPGWVDRLAWKTFEKAFHRDPATGHLRGWNARLEQTGWSGPPKPQLRDQAPITFGHFRVVPAAGRRRPAPAPGALLLDYGLGGNRAFDPVRMVRDPLVAVESGSTELLLGGTWLALGWGSLGTPSFFLLRRSGALEHRVDTPLKTSAV